MVNDFSSLHLAYQAYPLYHVFGRSRQTSFWLPVGDFMDELIEAGEFKSECLKIIDKVKRTRRRIIIAKRNKPIAQLLPIEEKTVFAYGCMRGTVEILGDILSPSDEVWDANC